MERIITIVCPSCKNSVKYDNLTGVTTGVPVEDYPKLNEEGRAWCKKCQHGTYPDEDGLCTTCLEQGRATRIQPLIKKEKEKVVDDAPIEKLAEKPIEKVKKVNVKYKKQDKKSPGLSSKAL